MHCAMLQLQEVEDIAMTHSIRELLSAAQADAWVYRHPESGNLPLLSPLPPEAGFNNDGGTDEPLFTIDTLEKVLGGNKSIFAADVLGNPMREHAPGKWEGAIWPSATRANEFDIDAVRTDFEHAYDEVNAECWPAGYRFQGNYRDSVTQAAWQAWRLSAHKYHGLADKPAPQPVDAASREFSDRVADVCNVDREDHWKYLNEDVIADVQMILQAANDAEASQAPEQAAVPTWRVGLFWSSASPETMVLMLAVGEEIKSHAAHRDFIRWVSPALSEQQPGEKS